MTTFASLFQTAVKSEALVSMPLDSLLEASSNASTAQYDLNPRIVSGIVKSLVGKKGSIGQLLIAPKLCTLTEDDSLNTVGGRHRSAAIEQVCRLYGINAKGLPELYTEVNRSNLTPILPEVDVNMMSVDNREHLAALIVADNCSRTMTAPEKASVAASGGYATAGDVFKLRFMPILATQLEALEDAEGGLINVTAVTLGQIVGELRASIVTTVSEVGEKIKTKVGIANLMSATDEQLNVIAQHLGEYLADDERELPTKFAQFHKPFVVDFLQQEINLVDEDGDSITNYDSDGNAVPMTYAEYMNSQIKVEPKVIRTKATKGVDKAALDIYQAKLLEMGIDPAALLKGTI